MGLYFNIPQNCSKCYILIGNYIHPGGHNQWEKQKMNHILKKSIAKIYQETNLTWYKALLVALLQIRVAPQSRSFEIWYGRYSKCLLEWESL